MVSPSNPIQIQPTRPAPASPFVPFQKKTMSITQTYYLAHKARAKLSRQAARSDHDLRLLVGHANLLDSLMLELADAEREQESWFNQSVRGASVHHEQRIEYEDAIIEEPEDEDAWDSSDSSENEEEEEDEDEASSDKDEDVVMANTVSVRRVPGATIARIARDYEHAIEDDDEEQEREDEKDEDEEDFAQLGLVRTHSHNSPPPELDDDSESSEDEPMPPSPPTQSLTFSEKDVKEAEEHATFYSEGFYLPSRSPARISTSPNAPIPVY